MLHHNGIHLREDVNELSTFAERGEAVFVARQNPPLMPVAQLLFKTRVFEFARPRRGHRV